MIRPATDLERVYVYRHPVDMRKAINGLVMLVESVLSLDPFSSQLFVFCNRRRDIVKIVYWERNGFCLWMKKLEKERFKWPRDGEVITLDGQQLNWLLDGAPQAHRGPAQGRKGRLWKAIGEMAVGPPKSAVRSRLQTTSSGCH